MIPSKTNMQLHGWSRVKRHQWEAENSPQKAAGRWLVVIEQFVKQKRAPIFHRLQKETETISVSIMDSFVVDNQTHNSDWRERRITRGGGL